MRTLENLLVFCSRMALSLIIPLPVMMAVTPLHLSF